MARIEVGPVWAALHGTPNEIEIVHEALSVDTPDADQVPAFKTGRWDGKTMFLRRQDRQFLSGLTWRVARALKAAGSAPEIAWRGVTLGKPITSRLTGIDLREYQIETVDRAVLQRRMAIQCPTGGGKTEIGFEILRRLGLPALWVTHRKELFDQTVSRFRDRMDVEPGIIIGRKFMLGPVTFGMVQTLHNVIHHEKGIFKEFQAVIFDEAHHASADTWQAVGRECSNAEYRYGLSGTLSQVGSEVDRMKIEGLTGPTHVVATTSALAAQGFLATPRVVILRSDPAAYPSYEQIRQEILPDWKSDPRRLQKMGGALFRTMYERGVVGNEPRNVLAMEVAMRHVAAGERFLILCNRVPHAAGLGAMIRRRHPGCVVLDLDGGAKDAVRRAALDAFRAASGSGGALLIATPFFREGVDVPQIDAGMLAGGGVSDIAVLQALGRMLRPRSDKTGVLIYDFADERNNPLDKRPDKEHLAIHFSSRLALYGAQGFMVERG